MRTQSKCRNINQQIRQTQEKKEKHLYEAQQAFQTQVLGNPQN